VGSNPASPTKTYATISSKHKGIYMKNEKGFGLVEIIIIIVILGVIGFGGWYVWQANNPPQPQSKTQTETPAQNQAEPKEEPVDPYDGWKSYTFKYEKFSLKYPATYTVTGTSSATEGVNPGSDVLKLTKQGLVINIHTGLSGIGGVCEACKVVLSKEVTFLGAKVAANFVDNGTGKVNTVVVTKDKNDWFGAGIKGKNIKSTYDNQPLPMGISIRYQANGEIVQKDLNEIAASADIAEAIKILESAHY
jgi:hypothetical protein